MNSSRKAQPSRARGLGPLLASLLVACLMVGCGGGQSIIKGRVIAGPVGQSVTANPGDERFSDTGIPGVKVSVLHKGGSVSQGRGVYTNAVSDEYGNFELAFAGGQYPRDAVEIRVSGDGIFTSRSQTFLPKEGGQLLCVVITRPGHVFPKPENPEPEQNQ